MKGKVPLILCVVLLALVAAYMSGKHFLYQSDWTLISSAQSPNGEFTIKYYQSRSEAGHAPYGDNLIIESWRSFPRPKSGETFFAGYCEEHVKFKWVSNEKIVVECKTKIDPIRTKVSVVHGIKVEVITK